MWLCKISTFFHNHPAFLYGLSSFIGAALSLTPVPITVFILILALPFLYLLHAKINGDTLRRPLLALFIALSAYYLTESRYQYPLEIPAGPGTATIDLLDVAHTKSSFGKSWIYRANLMTFTYDGKAIAKNIPVKMTLPDDPLLVRPKAGFRYTIEATLKKGTHGGYYLKPSNTTHWTTKNHSWSIAEWRYSTKKSIKNYIHNSIIDPHTASFLSGMFTGVFDDRILAFELGRFGLQHLMAISGLHFSILSAIIGLLCAMIMPKKAAAVSVIIMMTAYFAFLGASSSVVRAWISILIGLTAVFLEKRGSGLNALGIGLLAVSLWDPHQIREIGFQFSFGVTGAILLWYAPCEKFLQKIFLKRTLRDTAPMDKWDQHGYCLLFFLRQTLALCLAVNIVALPLTLYHFQKFPLFSLAYNLFFPTMVSLSLLLLIMAVSIGWALPAIASWLHALNESYTSFLLNFAFNLPRGFDIAWQINSFPSTWLLILLLTTLFVGITLQKEADHPIADHFV